MLDHAYFPHIVEDAFRRTDHATLLALRLVSRRAKALAEAELFAHVLVAPSSDGRAYAVRSVEGALPLQPWRGGSCPASSSEAEGLRLLTHARVLDVHTSLPPGALRSTLAAIPTRRGAYHRFLAPGARTYVQEYAVYMGSHWRDRTFYFDPPPGVARYVVHLRYHVDADRRLCELYGPAPSCDRILANLGQAGPEYTLIFSGCAERAAPSVPTHGLAASQRRSVHTLLYELAAGFEGLRRAQRAALTVVGAEEFVASLCGATSTLEAGRLFESKLALARRDMVTGEEEGAGSPAVVYFSHREYESVVGGRAYEAETRPVQLY